ncbi:hypothetical protein A1351_20280 [Methylosinus sp. R-45379]|uniref:hypothetical protein n=1 Tax=Methylosinus sp. R-45379 TaxID=980563 RepID=UPI0007C881F9|nr:hypothetical protein [Methylosinus sp. R-45379]OAI22908.1 hypothetical protein A1351_20280 [Methylosinus sp. R-45379]
MIDAAPASASTLGPASLAELWNAARWPQTRAEMVDPLLVTCRLAEDITDLFEAHEELSPQALAALGWPEHIIQSYLDIACNHAAAICARRLQLRRAEMLAAAMADPLIAAEPDFLVFDPDPLAATPTVAATMPLGLLALCCGAALGAVTSLALTAFLSLGG